MSIAPPAGATTHAVVEFDELLGPDGAAAMVELCARFGRYGMYSQEHVESDIGKGLSQRHDAASNFVRTGGRYARNEPKAVLAARTNYFREEYAYGQRAADRRHRAVPLPRGIRGSGARGARTDRSSSRPSCSPI